MPAGWAAAAVGVVGAISGAKSAKNAQSAQEEAAARADETQRYMYDTTRADNSQFLKAGQDASKRLSMLSGVGSEGQGTQEYGSLNRKFNQSDLNSDVVYNSGLQFGLDEGRKGLERQASATGSMLSGATLKALSRFGNDYASTKAGGAYDRYTQENTNIGNRLASLSGAGQVASNQVGQAGQNYANQSSAIETGLGNARAASSIAQGNAISGALNNGVSQYQNSQYIDALNKRK